MTGAARGIGRGIALVLGQSGATVYVTDRETPTAELNDLNNQWSSLGPSLQYV